MKRRDEDRIIDLAFGEIPESEATRLEQQFGSSPAAAQTLSQFKALKTDLALLNNIPDHQISTERIREAILRGGLKQKRNGWAWALVPALGAVASLIMVLSRSSAPETVSRLQTSQPETIVAFEPAPVRENVFHPETELTNITHAVRSTYSYGSAPSADLALAGKRTERHRRESDFSEEVNSGMVALSNTDQTGDAVVPAQDPTPANQPAEQVPTDLTAAPNADDTSAAATGDSQKIIVVHDSQDGSTGAQQATEVDPTSHVVVGG